MATATQHAQLQQRLDAFEAARAVRAAAVLEANQRALEALAALQLDVAVPVQALTAPLVPGDLERAAAGARLLAALAEARMQAELVRSGLQYRLEHGHAADSELQWLDAQLVDTRRQLRAAETNEARAAGEEK